MYNHEEIEKANKKKGMFVSSFAHALLILLLLFYAAPNVEALDEGGLIASFGDVELAGPSEVAEEEVTPEEQPEEVVEEEVIEEEVEEVINSETIDDSDVSLPEEKPKEPKKEPKKEPTKEPKKEPAPKTVRKPKGPASFGGKNNGSGTASGEGKQGTQFGKLGGGGFSDKDGKGKGKGLGTRTRTSSKCDISVGSLKTDSKAIFKICVNAQGKVTSVKVVSENVDSQSLLNKAKNCVRQWQYSPAPGAKSACGNVEFEFNLK